MLSFHSYKEGGLTQEPRLKYLYVLYMENRDADEKKIKTHIF